MIELPAGFCAAGVAAGLKPSGGLDVGILVSDRAAAAAGVFTSNRYAAPPIEATKRRLRKGTARAVVVNSGNANACTGREGLADAEAMAAAGAGALGIHRSQVLVASTGVIGERLDVDAVATGIHAAALQAGRDGLGAFAEAIMTTDTRPKLASARAGASTIVGVAKGAGMIAPDMATMLAFVMTDATVDRGVLGEAVRAAAAETFNAVSIDGCMSTNDIVLALANGASGDAPVTRGDAGVFREALTDVCASLARQIADDGEGATKLVTLRIEGATTEREARRAARAIADSVLLRCALAGGDPYWGRVLAALGSAPIPFDPHVVDVWMGGEKLAEGGRAGPGDREKARTALRDREIEIVVDLHRGPATATLLTNDLSVEYVRFNTEYTT